MSSDSLADRRSREAAAIENCENEVIEFVGTVQPFGALLGFDAQLEIITHASENVREHLGLDAAELLGQMPEAAIGAEAAHRTRNVAGLRSIRTNREYIGRYDIAGKAVELMGHAVDGTFIVEIQPAGDELSGSDVLGAVRQVMAEVDLDADVVDVLRDAVDPLRELTGFDRVKAYRFATDGSGEVVAESRRPTVDSFLGLHFPAEDIPQSARRLYATTPIRCIADVHAEQSPILARSSTDADLDLSLAAVRGTVEVHCQYLRNMGVGATLSLPIVVEGDLWGLFAFHHDEPMALSAGMLMACEVTGRSLSMGIEQRIRRERYATSERSIDLVAAIVAEDDGSAGLGVDWKALAPELLDYLPCDGVAVFVADQIYRAGSVPDAGALLELRDTLVDADSVVAVADLPVRFPHLDLALTAGSLLLDAAGVDGFSVMFCRDRAELSIEWAGSPSKDIEDVAGELRLHPRASFDEFIESVSDRSTPWSAADVLAAEGMQGALVSSIRVRDAARSHNERLGLVVRELNHRVRNVLSLVQSLAIQTRGSSDSLDRYASRMEERIGLLAAAHDLLTASDWTSIDLESLIRQTAAPFINEHEEAIELSGAPIRIHATAASLMALLVHELFSNAARHGSLSRPGGEVLVDWGADDEWLTFRWRERGGPRVDPPQRRGFGTVILTEAVPFELEGLSSIDFHRSGLEGEISIPLRFTDSLVTVAELTATTDDDGQAVPSLPATALVVEDDFLISRETVRVLQRLGCPNVDAVPSAKAALARIADEPPGFAVLDVNLKGDFSGPVADRLVELGIPFLFLTGFGSGEISLDRYPDVPVLTKPLREGELRSTLVGLFEPGS